MPFSIPPKNIALDIPVSAALMSAIGMETYREAQSVYASHMANIQSDGYMHSFVTFVTNGYYGPAVRDVEENAFCYFSKGSLEATRRPLDLGVEGQGFLVVDTSGSSDSLLKEYGLKTTGRFQMDKDGFLHDEGGSFLLGVRVSPGSAAPTVSTFDGLERVKIETDPKVPVATSAVKIKGLLPADKINVSEGRESGASVYDQLGHTHSLLFRWTKMNAPLLWRLNVRDSEGSHVTQNAPGGSSWEDPTEGIFVGFDSVGQYKGWAPSSAPIEDEWQKNLQQWEGFKAVLDALEQLYQNDSTLTLAQLHQEGQDFITATYPDPTDTEHITGAEHALLLFDAGRLGTPRENLDEAQRVAIGLKQTADEAQIHVVDQAFFTDSPLPLLSVAPWTLPTGEEASIPPVTLSIKKMGVSGETFQFQTAEQDGQGIDVLQGLSFSPDGFLFLNFANQPAQGAWMIPLANYINNNELRQDCLNVLRETPTCGELVLAQPTTAHLGSLRGSMINVSNVKAAETLLKAHEVAQASQYNATLYRTDIEKDRYLMQMFAQM